MEYLNRGFAYAQEFLEPEEYFQILRCYEKLSHLQLSDKPGEAQDLQCLLSEAEIIYTLEKHAPLRHTQQQYTNRTTTDIQQPVCETRHCDAVD